MKERDASFRLLPLTWARVMSFAQALTRVVAASASGWTPSWARPASAWMASFVRPCWPSSCGGHEVRGAQGDRGVASASPQDAESLQLRRMRPRHSAIQGPTCAYWCQAWGCARLVIALHDCIAAHLYLSCRARQDFSSPLLISLHALRRKRMTQMVGTGKPLIILSQAFQREDHQPHCAHQLINLLLQRIAACLRAKYRAVGEARAAPHTTGGG